MYVVWNTEDLVQAIFSQPFTKVNHLTDVRIYAENTSRDYLAKLVELRLLEKKEISGKHYYLNTELKKFWRISNRLILLNTETNQR